MLVLIGESWYTVACTTGAPSEAARAADVDGASACACACACACDGWRAEVGAGVLTGVVEYDEVEDAPGGADSGVEFADSGTGICRQTSPCW